MTQDEAFLRAIFENPDDGVRLAYADWLEEHGQAERAEFIRVQCELAKVRERDLRRQGLEAREEQLLWVAHRECWVQQFGVAMTWGNALALVRWRLPVRRTDSPCCRVHSAIKSRSDFLSFQPYKRPERLRG